MLTTNKVAVSYQWNKGFFLINRNVFFFFAEHLNDQ